MTNDPWFPDGIDTSPASDNYLNVKKLEIGKECRIRILSTPIHGKERWGKLPGAKSTDSNKPFRAKPGHGFADGIQWEPDRATGEMRAPMDFMAFVVWNYALGRVQILSITQKSIMKELKSYSASPDWGPPVTYDIGITRKEDAGKTAYAVMPKPHKPLDPAIAGQWAALQAAGFNLDAFFEGKNPFPEMVEQAPPPTDADLPF